MPVQNKGQVGPNFLETPGPPKAPLPSLTFRPLTLVAANLRNNPTFLHRTTDKPEGEWGGGHPLILMPVQNKGQVEPNFLEALWIGCFWVVKPTFPRISPGKRGKSGMVSSFSLLGDTSRLESPSKRPTSTFSVICFKVS